MDANVAAARQDVGGDAASTTPDISSSGAATRQHALTVAVGGTRAPRLRPLPLLALIHPSAWKTHSRKSVHWIPHWRYSRGQVVGRSSGPGIESCPCAAFHLATY
jgi:hypothetical protein